MSRGISVTFFFDKLNLDVGIIVGIHGDSATMQAARAAAQSGK
jgi:hypothetical protein